MFDGGRHVLCYDYSHLFLFRVGRNGGIDKKRILESNQDF